MATVAETKEIFNKKGLNLKIPIDDNFEVQNIDIVERYTYPGGGIHYLLKITFTDEDGGESYDLFSCDGKIKRNKPIIEISKEVPKPSSLDLLPERGRIDFENDAEAFSYITESIIHLLLDKGYEQMESDETDLYFTKKGRGFFINLLLRCNKNAMGLVNDLIKVRGQFGPKNDYGIVYPAIQDSLGISLLVQENWLREYGEYLSAHRVCVLGVNNSDPNLIFPYTIFPKEREIARYLIHTSPQWSMLREKYLSMKRKQSAS